MRSDLFGIALILLLLACPVVVIAGLAAMWGRQQLTPLLVVLGVTAIVLGGTGLWLAIDPLVVDGITCFDMPVFDLHTGDTAACLAQNRWHAGMGSVLGVAPTVAWLVLAVRHARHSAPRAGTEGALPPAGTSNPPGA